MKKKGLAKFGQILGNVFTGHLKDYEYPRKKFAKWDIAKDAKWILKNVNIIDVDRGAMKRKKAILINGEKIDKLMSESEIALYKRSNKSIQFIDAKNQYLIPGLSDIHCHLGLVSEYDFSWNTLYHADAQRMKNCEFTLENGCTFTRTSGGTYDMMSQLKTEIEADR